MKKKKKAPARKAVKVKKALKPKKAQKPKKALKAKSGPKGKSAPKKPLKKAAPKKPLKRKAAPKKAVSKKPVKKAVPKKTKPSAKPSATMPKKTLQPKAKAARPEAARPEAARPEAAKKPVEKAAPLKPERKAAQEVSSRKAPQPEKKPAPIPVRTVVVMDAARRDALRKTLLHRRQRMVEDINAEVKKYISGDSRQIVESVLDSGDWSTIDLSEDINLKKLDTMRSTLQKIDEAVRKLNEGSYGVCEECGDEIAAERLKVLPFAIFCRDCQENRELIESLEKSSEPHGS